MYSRSTNSNKQPKVAEAAHSLEYVPKLQLTQMLLTSIHPQIGKWMDQFGAYMRSSTNLTDTTIRHYMHDLIVALRYMKQHEADIHTVDQIKTETIHRYIDYLKYDRLNSNSSVNRRLAALKRFFRYLVDKQAVEKNPVDPIEKLQKREVPLIVLTRDEALRLLEASKTSTHFPLRDHAIFQLFLTCGCTLSELLNLNRFHLNLKRRTILLTNRKGIRRTINLSEGCYFALHRYIKDRGHISPGNALFINRRDVRISKGAINHAFRLIWKKAGIDKEGITTRSLRHTCITLHWEAGMTLIQLQMFAGHSSIATTKRYTRGTRQKERPDPNKPIFPLDC